jgi:hypothetical protein
MRVRLVLCVKTSNLTFVEKRYLTKVCFLARGRHLEEIKEHVQCRRNGFRGGFREDFGRITGGLREDYGDTQPGFRGHPTWPPTGYT